MIKTQQKQSSFQKLRRSRTQTHIKHNQFQQEHLKNPINVFPIKSQPIKK
jgi:hypothetical protein